MNFDEYTFYDININFEVDTMPETTTWIQGAIVITSAATIQSITGFGFGLAAIPFLIMIYNPKMAVGLSIILSFCGLLTLLFKIKKETQWDMVKKLFLGAIFGLPVGVFIFKTVNVGILKIIISFTIIILSLLMTLKIRFRINSNNKKIQFITGTISGILTSSIGMPGPPIVLLLSNLELTKEKFRATTVAYFVLIYPSSFITLATTGSIPLNTFTTALTLLPFIFIGLKIGSKIFKTVPAEKFKNVVLFLLIMVGLYSIITTV
ncbi:MAG: hypothetical protein JG764_1010 [Clostridiales bacterium]|jgi:uncharacterized membrane protein YfcA|nr:hypothetical protein [Clostridiales bacterium]